MYDQAAKLREIASTDIRHNPNYAKRIDERKIRAKVITVSSGKGGVGKTSTAVNTALKLCDTGADVLLIDADINLSNANILLGLTAEYDLSDAIIKNFPVKDVILTAPNGLHILSGGSGLNDIAELTEVNKQRFFRQLGELERNYDYIIIDTPAGLTKQILDLQTFAHQNVIVITPEPTSISDSYAVIKVLTMNNPNIVPNIVINRVGNFEEAKQLYKKFKMVVDKFLQIRIKYMGYISDDKNMSKSVIQQVPMVIGFPNSPASKCIEGITEQIISNGKLPLKKISESFFGKYIKNNILN